MTLRADLTPLPTRIARLPVDRGYPVPWFVEWLDGRPEFRLMDGGKFTRAIRERRCWICGAPLGQFLMFVLGPMCTLTRTTAEPPCHAECAEWSARNCPFLTRPQMTRRDDALMQSAESRGLALDRNPGVVALWTTKSFSLFPDQHRRPLITVGAPLTVRWFAEGRSATRAEVVASIDSGLPALEAAAEQEDTDERRAEARRAIHTHLDEARGYWPPESAA